MSSVQSKKQIAVLAVQGAKTFKLDREKIVIGSVISADLRLMGQGISPIHAVIEISDGKATVYDLASDSGVLVNGKKEVTVALNPGDTIRIGEHDIRFSWGEAETALSSGRVFNDSVAKRKLYMNSDEDLKPLLLEEADEVREIFDYRPSEKPAVEVVMSWCGTIIDVEHFTSRKSVKIGHVRGCDFGVPPSLPTKTHIFVSRQQDEATLHLVGGMKGIVQTEGALKSVQASGASSSIPLGKHDFAKISLGEVDFYVSFTASPPRIKKSFLSDRDPLFLRLLGMSLLTSAVIILGLYNMKVSPNIEAEQLPERIATILYQPEKFLQPKKEVPKLIKKQEPEPVKKEEPVTPPPPPKPVKVKVEPKPAPPEEPKKPMPKQMDVGPKTPKPQPVKASGPKGSVGPKKQDQAKEGAGAKAKGPEGKRGTQASKASGPPQTEAKRASPMGGEGKGAGNSQVADQGNLDLLKGASGKIQDLLGNSAAQLGKSGSKLQGFGGFDTKGSGGQALAGKGSGGGGDAEGLGGLADKGRGGGRVGTGMGAAGSGSGIIGGKTRVVLQSGGDDETVIMGAVDADAIRRAIEAHRDEFRYCYEKEINAETKAAAGKVTSSFVIGSSGRVTQAGVETTTLKNANIERCVVQVIKRIEFPAPKGGGIVQITYPFSFAPAK